METEVFNCSAMPERGYHLSQIKSAKLVAFRESLALLDHLPARCYLWVMEQHGASKTWTRKYSIDFVMSNLLDFKKNGELLFCYRENEVKSYDIVNHQMRLVAKARIRSHFFDGPYVDSLGLLRGQNT